jgi:hypothetical protein
MMPSPTSLSLPSVKSFFVSAASPATVVADEHQKENETMSHKSINQPQAGASVRRIRRRQILLGGASVVTAAALSAAAVPASAAQSRTAGESRRSVSAPVGGTTYMIRQVSSGRYMDAHETNASGLDYRVVTRPFQNNNTQRWKATFLGSNKYRLQQVSSGRYLDAYETNASGLDYRLVTRPFQNNNTQRWSFRPL